MERFLKKIMIFTNEGTAMAANLGCLQLLGGTSGIIDMFLVLGQWNCNYLP